MISTVSDLLVAFSNKEKELLKKYSIVKHAPIIGSMYEGLTKALIEKSIFANLNLKVVSGKIKNQQYQMSNQIDCMLVEGEGENIPFTNDYIYDIKQVIAVIEVKKNLYSKDLDDSYNNLVSVVNINDQININTRLLRDAFVNICGEELPDEDEIKNESYEKRLIYYALLTETILPLRIVFGYYGFVSEYSLREAFFSYLKSSFRLEILKL